MTRLRATSTSIHALLACLALAACGDDGEAPPGAVPSQAASAPSAPAAAAVTTAVTYRVADVLQAANTGEYAGTMPHVYIVTEGDETEWYFTTTARSADDPCAPALERHHIVGLAPAPLQPGRHALEPETALFNLLARNASADPPVTGRVTQGARGSISIDRVTSEEVVGRIDAEVVDLDDQAIGKIEGPFVAMRSTCQ